jgi:hypothetical protein
MAKDRPQASLDTPRWLAGLDDEWAIWLQMRGASTDPAYPAEFADMLNDERGPRTTRPTPGIEDRTPMLGARMAVRAFGSRFRRLLPKLSPLAHAAPTATHGGSPATGT